MKVQINLLITLALLLSFAQTAAPPAIAAPPAPLQYVSPRPGARNISPTTSLAIRAASQLDARTISAERFLVTGSASGSHPGQARLAADGRTLLFYPGQPFAYGETVSVTLQAGLATADGARVAGQSYEFTIIEQPISDLAAQVGRKPAKATAMAPLAPPMYRTYQEFGQVMTATVTTPAQNTADGLVFAASLNFIYDRAALIYDNNGEPVFIQPTPSNAFVADFKKQTVGGTPYLTYHAGISSGAWTIGTGYVLDTSYQLVSTWTIGNGYGADLHEFLLQENGNVLLMNYTPVPYDLRPFGGPQDGVVLELLLQEQDPQQNVLFEWHSLDHIPLTDTYSPLNESLVDYIHGNAIEVDSDGNLLISSRNTWEITKINRETGAVMWRLGGKQNQFNFGTDIGFSYQHDIRRLPNGNITLFDNGSAHTPPHSRAVEYAIDEQQKTVTRVWQYPEDTSEHSRFMGNAQRLPNGNTFIGWGDQPKFSEVRADGTTVFEAKLSGFSYRAFRYPWSATPAAEPRAAVSYGASETAATVYAAWNGATEITGYEVYAGPNFASMALVTTADRSGFETAIPLTNLPAGTCFFKVRPLRAQGPSLPFSRLAYRIDQSACNVQISMIQLPLMMNN